MLSKLAKSIGFGKSSSKAWKTNSAPHGFHGGLCLDTNKRALGNNNPTSIVNIEPPELLVVPLINYGKQTLSPHVQLNEQVQRGQAVAPGICAPVSGCIEGIEHRQIIHPGGLQALSVIIRNDGLDTSIRTNADQPLDQTHVVAPQGSHATVKDKIARFVARPELVLDHAALVGLGGAGFPTTQKILPTNQNIQTLIINAAECEPEIACDEALMQTSAAQIAYGILALVSLTQCSHCVLAIEDTKTQAIASMRSALQNIDGNVELMIIPTRYPTGAQSLLIQTVTGQFIPHNEQPIAHGVLCINVATAHALWLAINGQPLDSRVVSLGGAGMPNPCNVRVRFGTLVSYVLEQTGNAPAVDTMRIRAGGPLSGFDLHSTDVPVTATTNCILCEPAISEPIAQPCIRCGDCADVCPAMLQPQQLYWYTQAAEHDKCDALHLDACIECGCCDLVCPSSIKLTETFRFEKSNANFIKAQQASAILAEQRFEERKVRIEMKTQARQRAIEQRKEKLKTPSQPDSKNISAALARARAKQNAKKDS